MVVFLPNFLLQAHLVPLVFCKTSFFSFSVIVSVTSCSLAYVGSSLIATCCSDWCLWFSNLSTLFPTSHSVLCSYLFNHLDVSECTLHVTVSGSVPSRVMSGDALGQSRAAGQVCFAGQLALLSQSGWKNHYFYTLRCISWWLKATEPSLSDTVFPPKTPSREWPQQVSVLLSAVCPTLCILFLPASLSAHTLVAYLCHSLTVWMFPVNLMNYMNKQILLSICPYFIECKASFS